MSRNTPSTREAPTQEEASQLIDKFRNAMKLERTRHDTDTDAL